MICFFFFSTFIIFFSFQCYRRILQLEPDNVQGLHNLCVVLVERGRLATAARCLRRAAHLAPREGYIRRHLAIVLQRLAKDSTTQTEQNYQIDTFLKEEDPTFNPKTIDADYLNNEVDKEIVVEEKSQNSNLFPSNIPIEEEVVRFNGFLRDQREVLRSDGDDPSSGMS